MAPFGDITGHVIQTVVVRPVGTHRSGQSGTVVQVTGNTHVVARTFLEVSHEATHISLVVGAETVAVPRINFALTDDFVGSVAHQTDSGIFPFGFRRQAVGGQQDAIIHADVTHTVAAFREVFLAVLHLAGVLASKISVGVEVLLVLLRRIPVEDAGFNEHQLIDAVGTPSAVIAGLHPCHADNGIVVVRRMAEINLHHGLVV